MHPIFTDSFLSYISSSCPIFSLGYFESTPVGRLIQRFSKDLDAIDQQLPNSLGQLLASSITIIASMVGITLVTPSFGLLMMPGGWYRHTLHMRKITSSHSGLTLLTYPFNYNEKYHLTSSHY